MASATRSQEVRGSTSSLWRKVRCVFGGKVLLDLFGLGGVSLLLDVIGLLLLDENDEMRSFWI